MAWTLTTFKDGSTTLGFTTEECNGTYREAGRRGEGLDQAYDATKTSQGRRYPKLESNRTMPTKKARDLPPLELGILVAGKLPPLEIKRDCKKIVDWVDGHAKKKTRVRTVENSPNSPMVMAEGGIRLRQPTTEWATHTFREHNNDADLWAGKGAKGRVEEWVDTTRFAWTKVTCLWILGREL